MLQDNQHIPVPGPGDSQHGCLHKLALDAAPNNVTLHDVPHVHLRCFLLLQDLESLAAKTPESYSDLPHPLHAPSRDLWNT